MEPPRERNDADDPGAAERYVVVDGRRWRDDPTAAGERARIAATTRALLRSRRPDSSICPSDVARAIGGGRWRRLLPLVREVAGSLAQQGIVVVTQGGEPVDVHEARGPVRIRRGAGFPGG